MNEIYFQNNFDLLTTSVMLYVTVWCLEFSSTIPAFLHSPLDPSRNSFAAYESIGRPNDPSQCGPTQSSNPLVWPHSCPSPTCNEDACWSFSSLHRHLPLERFRERWFVAAFQYHFGVCSWCTATGLTGGTN